MAERPIYLDCQATTPLDPRVVSAMVEAFDVFGNPHGRQHPYARAAANTVDTARSQVAGLVGAYPQRIVFTSGATESCNLALRGAARAAPPERRRIVTLATEHAAVLETVNDLGQQGFEAIVLPVEPDGLVDFNRLEDTVDDRTLIVFGHGREQRDRRDPAAHRGRFDLPPSRSAVPHRCDAGARPDQSRRRGLGRRSLVDVVAQALRTEGGGSALRGG